MQTVVGGRPRRRPGRRGRLFVIQWHLTARCTEDCRHCYARDAPDLAPQLEGELSTATCMKVLDDLEAFLKGNGLVGRVNFTGGDPLLKDGLMDLVRSARARGIMVGILGNPSNLDHRTATALKEAGVFRYQLSIDGRRATHDGIRGRRGHFDDTVRALEVLREVGLPSVVMFTLSRQNAADLPAVAEVASEMGAAVFDFARLVPQGRGRGLEMLSPREYRNTLVDVLGTYKRLEGEGCRTYFGRKEALWNLLYLERGEFVPPEWDGVVRSGCSAGTRVLTVLADGTVYPCRRLPIRIGKVPEDGLTDIFFNARAQVELRNVANFEKCRGCSLLPYCRGCPGVAYGATEDPFAADPQCWREEGDHGTGTVRATGLGDHALWARGEKAGRRKGCASCDGACGGCGHICAACSEVCAGCSARD